MRLTNTLSDYLEKLEEALPCLLTETGNPKDLKKIEKKVKRAMKHMMKEEPEEISFLTEKGRDAL